MRPSAQRTASARLGAMPALISVSTISSSAVLSRAMTGVKSLSAVPGLLLEEHFEVSFEGVATGVFERDVDAPDLGQSLCQLAAELVHRWSAEHRVRVGQLSVFVGRLDGDQPEQ